MLIKFIIGKKTYETINFTELYKYNLSRIRFLSITQSLIIDLPKKLINLETLILNNCMYLKTIPEYKKLKVLELSNCDSFLKIPNFK